MVEILADEWVRPSSVTAKICTTDRDFRIFQAKKLAQLSNRDLIK
jgi:hypothetical protein